MRDPERIDDTLAALDRIWKRYPDMRLGQLIGHAVRELHGEERGMTDGRLMLRVLTIEDDRLLEGLDSLARKLAWILCGESEAT